MKNYHWCISTIYFQINRAVLKVDKEVYRNRTGTVEAKLHQYKDQSDLYSWTDWNVSSNITLSYMYHFFGVLCCFRITSISRKSNYWTQKWWMPDHPILRGFGVTYRQSKEGGIIESEKFRVLSPFWCR